MALCTATGRSPARESRPGDVQDWIELGLRAGEDLTEAWPRAHPGGMWSASVLRLLPDWFSGSWVEPPGPIDAVVEEDQLETPA